MMKSLKYDTYQNFNQGEYSIELYLTNRTYIVFARYTDRSLGKTVGISRWQSRKPTAVRMAIEDLKRQCKEF